MKKLYYLLFSTMLAAVLFSCKKQGHDENIKNITLDATVTAGGPAYRLNVSQYGDADDIAVIASQASDFVTSEIVKDAVTGKYTYTYMRGLVPKIPGNSVDKVVLKVTEPGGCRGRKGETNITINFTIL